MIGAELEVRQRLDYHSPLPGQGRQFILRLAYEYGR